MDTPCERPFVMFHGYKIMRDSTVYGKSGKPIKKEKRPRRGGGFDWCVRLYYGKKSRKWTLSRLMGACFIGPIDGYEMNHKDRDPSNCHIDNIERTTPSENQKHWRNTPKE